MTGIRRRGNDLLRATALTAAMITLAACALSGTDPQSNTDGPPFPLSGTYWLNQDFLPTVEELKREHFTVPSAPEKGVA